MSQEKSLDQEVIDFLDSLIEAHGSAVVLTLEEAKKLKAYDDKHWTDPMFHLGEYLGCDRRPLSDKEFIEYIKTNLDNGTLSIDAPIVRPFVQR